MSRRFWNGLWIVLVCWNLACTKPAESPSNTSTGDTTNEGKAKVEGRTLMPPGPDDDTGVARATDKSKKKRLAADEANPFQEASPVDTGPARKSLAGRWILVLTRPTKEGGFIDFHTGIVDISAAKGDADDKSLQAKWIAQTGVLQPTELEKAELTVQQAQLIFNVSGTPLNFQGALKNGVVYGNAVFGNCLPARLVPTKEASLEAFNPAPEPADLRTLGEAFATQNQNTAIKSLRKFVVDRPDSPLGMIAWENLIMLSAIRDVSVEDIEGLISDYETAMTMWGPRLQQAAKGNVAVVLADSRFNPEFSLKYVAAVNKTLTDESLKDLKDQLKTARESILTIQALKLVESDDAERRQKAADWLTELRQKTPFDQTVLYGLARFHEKNKRTDKALELFAEIATLPMLEAFLRRDWAQNQKPDQTDRELPSETLAKLWEAKKGSSEGLDEFKDAVYRKRLTSFAEKPSEEAPSGNRVVLCELFTGAGCPPCVAADVATCGLEVTYPRLQVVVLRYHQHIPSPDPLTNADGEDRFASYYRGQGTPTVALNGALMDGLGGGIARAPEIYGSLRQFIDPQLSQKSPLKVRLAAKVEDDVLQIAADVQGLDQLQEEPGEVRLRVVIAEDEIPFLAKNGVRSHEMIVRRMVGGPEGIAAKDGKLTMKEAIPLADLKASLSDYLKKYEESENVDFPAKPLELKRLHIVAFVQNDESREVLQTNAVSVAAGDSTSSTKAITPAAGNAPARTSSKKLRSAE
jgi:hypothetical protein